MTMMMTMKSQMSKNEPMVRRLGEEEEDVAIIIDSGAALFPWSIGKVN